MFKFKTQKIKSIISDKFLFNNLLTLLKAASLTSLLFFIASNSSELIPDLDMSSFLVIPLSFMRDHKPS